MNRLVLLEEAGVLAIVRLSIQLKDFDRVLGAPVPVGGGMRAPSICHSLA